MSHWVRDVINPIEMIIYSESIEFQTLSPCGLERLMFLVIMQNYGCMCLNSSQLDDGEKRYD